MWRFALFLMFSGSVMADELSLERLFSSPDLAGASMRQVKVSPDGARVTFLQGKTENKDRYDLWEYNIDDGKTRLLVDSDVLQPVQEELSDEEKARRERQRLAGLSGIIEYDWSQDGQSLLFPLGGDLFVYRLGVATEKAVTQLTDSDDFDTDARFSPKGNFVSFIRNQDIFVVAVDGGHARPLTFDGQGVIKNGMAEFVAQEEMDRDTGYWWSPDETQIAFLRVDESPVSVTKRYEINADNIEVIEQRYPYTGEANVTLRLGRIELKTGDTHWIDTGEETDIYIPRVKWLPDSQALAFLRQSRNQQHLEMIQVDLAGKSTSLFTEQSDTWINLHHDWKFLDDGSFIWASELNGFKHLYHIKANQPPQAITAGDWVVDEIVGFDKDKKRVYFTGTSDSPLEKQLYWQSLDTDSPQKPHKITKREGTHQITMADNARVYIDTWSDREHPPQTSLHQADGERITWLNENALDKDHPYSPYLDAHIPNEFGTLKAEDGQILYYRIIKPADFSADKKYPVFFYTYGGPGAQLVSKAWPRRLFEQYMAQQGYLVFVLDNRGMARRGKKFEDPLYKQMGSVELNDQLVGVDYLKSLDFVDAERTGIFGWSYGGYMALRALTKAPDEFAIGVSVAPVSDFRLYDTHYTERYMSTPQLNAEGYNKTAIYGDTANLKDGRLLLIHGMADDNVLFTNATTVMKKFQDHGILFESMVYPGAKHGISGEQAQYHVYKTIFDFFERKLTVVE